MTQTAAAEVVKSSGSGSELRILTFTSLYPNRERPNHGVFVETRVRDVAGRAREQITGDVGDSASQWEMDRDDLAQDLPRMPKI